MQLNAAQRNYPTHEKELLAIIHGLQKFQAELLGTHFMVFTDYRTLDDHRPFQERTMKGTKDVLGILLPNPQNASLPSDAINSSIGNGINTNVRDCVAHSLLFYSGSSIHINLCQCFVISC
jgi:RNase H-like domain found in reverse transcriptase